MPPRRRFSINLPTEAQARMLALVWGNPNNRGVPVSDEGYQNPTTMVCINKGWLEKSGHTGTWPNGTGYASYTVSTTGLNAVACYLLDVVEKAKRNG